MTKQDMLRELRELRIDALRKRDHAVESVIALQEDSALILELVTYIRDFYGNQVSRIDAVSSALFALQD